MPWNIPRHEKWRGISPPPGGPGFYDQPKQIHWSIASNPQRYRDLGYAISCCRKRKGLTREQLTDQTGISRQHMGAIEAPNMVRAISVDILFNIAAILEIELYILLKFSPDKWHTPTARLNCTVGVLQWITDGYIQYWNGHSIPEKIYSLLKRNQALRRWFANAPEPGFVKSYGKTVANQGFSKTLSYQLFSDFRATDFLVFTWQTVPEAHKGKPTSW